MIKKSITIFLISISFAFAKISALEDSVQDSTFSIDVSNIYENKYNPFQVIFLGGVGYTSTKRFEVDIFCMSAQNLGSKLFSIDRLLADFTFLRFDRRLERTEGDKKIDDLSIGSAAISVGFSILGMAAPKESTLQKIAFGGLWLASGTTKYILYGNNLSGVALAESHAIEWFLRSEEKDNKFHYSFKEFGFVEEVGIQFGIFLAQVTAGVSFEITNKQRNIGWFFKIITLPFFMENFSRHEQNPPQVKPAVKP
ncbi:hypothetical protein [Fibrobacter sp. UWB11]|jgi:hypothetical protein|uniref:hypothetical protein n=1 Tax=Fibrobacter sp. UWB11 TaxID=1896202 RepID=UPI00092824A4|nr:hypothetical protein [Fibrobacter sp. UWB11]SIO34427.1 hypothetical protein SAMN05720758_2439 [Fibrobacter sp. UWB11]